MFSDNTEDLFGKTVNDLQSDVSIESGVVSGTLNYIDDYTSAGFDMSQGNHFLVVKATSATGATTTSTIDGRTVTLDSDGILVLQMTEAKKALDLIFNSTLPNGDKNTVKVKLSGLTLAAQ